MLRLFAALALILVAAPTVAENNGKAGQAGKLNAGKAAAGCPPGLAKKDPACVPPGLAKKALQQGDYVDGYFIRLPREKWEALDLPDPGEDSLYLQVDNQVLRVARDTYIVLEAVRILGRVLN
jgi:hypothetical protein